MTIYDQISFFKSEFGYTIIGSESYIDQTDSSNNQDMYTLPRRVFKILVIKMGGKYAKREIVIRPDSNPSSLVDTYLSCLIIPETQELFISFNGASRSSGLLIVDLQKLGRLGDKSLVLKAEFELITKSSRVLKNECIREILFPNLLGGDNPSQSDLILGNFMVYSREVRRLIMSSLEGRLFILDLDTLVDEKNDKNLEKFENVIKVAIKRAEEG